MGVVAGVASRARVGRRRARRRRRSDRLPVDDRQRRPGVPDTIDVRIVGGDSFVLLTADPGTDVVVLGYDNEPYLHFRADGVVEENRRSPTVYQNRSRYGSDDAPADADPTAAPEWQQVASGGSYAWHDHRAHWMLRSPARQRRARAAGRQRRHPAAGRRRPGVGVGGRHLGGGAVAPAAGRRRRRGGVPHDDRAVEPPAAGVDPRRRRCRRGRHRLLAVPVAAGGDRALADVVARARRRRRVGVARRALRSDAGVVRARAARRHRAGDLGAAAARRPGPRPAAHGRAVLARPRGHRLRRGRRRVRRSPSAASPCSASRPPSTTDRERRLPAAELSARRGRHRPCPAARPRPACWW